MRHGSTPRSGVTLKDLTVLAVLLFLLVALILPALQRSSSKAEGMKCLSRARAIASGLRSYAASWDGWTNPDPCSYVREVGYSLNTDTSAMGDAPPWYVPGTPSPSPSQLFAAGVTDFRCNFDESPIFNAHGIPTSYHVTAHFVGSNILQIRNDANLVPAVVEVGLRHPVGGRADRLGGIWVFADLSCRLLPEGAPQQGQ